MSTFVAFGTASGPAFVASTRPTRSPIPLLVPPQETKDILSPCYGSDHVVQIGKAHTIASMSAMLMYAEIS